MSSSSDSFSPEDKHVIHTDSANEQPAAEPSETPAGASEAPPASSETALPPEAQGETNGGPLGCCLGTVIGLLLSISIALVSRLYADALWSAFSGSLGILVRVLMALVAIAAAIICGYLGWKIGKKVYREYEPPVVKQRSKKPLPADRLKTRSSTDSR